MKPRKSYSIKHTSNIQYQGFTIHPYHQIVNSNTNKGNIYLGTIQAAKNYQFLRKNHIQAMLTVGKFCISPLLEISIPSFITNRKIIPIDDSQNQNIKQHFNSTFKFIQEMINRTNVLIHCKAGISRSATIMIAYLMRKNKWNTKQAYDFVKSKRKQICPNFSFCMQIKQFGEQMSGNYNSDYALQKLQQDMFDNKNIYINKNYTFNSVKPAPSITNKNIKQPSKFSQIKSNELSHQFTYANYRKLYTHKTNRGLQHAKSASNLYTKYFN